MYLGHSGSSPEPFDAIDGSRLAGPTGSHPLHEVSIEELLRPSSGAVEADFEFEQPDRPAVVGGGIRGRVRIRAIRDIDARGARLRLLGLKLVEERESDTDTDGKHSTTETWVEANGTLFVEDGFLEPLVPPVLTAGQVVELPFLVPAPRLGPPTAHLGEAIIAWALEVRWDVARSDDPFAAVLLPLAQSPDLMRAGVGEQGGQSLAASLDCGDGATIAIASELPAPQGTFLRVRPSWPTAPSGRAGRLELWRDTTAPNGEEGVVSSVPASIEAVRSGSAEIELLVPAGIAPSFDGAGVQIRYSVKVVVDRPMRPDASIQRIVAVV